MTNQIIQWEGDVLNRREIALFLEKLVIKKTKSGRVSPNANALCFALDGDWGTGKTFFVKKWIEDLRNTKYPVIHFDAWINDLTDDPLIGFMAYLKSSLEPLIKKLPLSQRVEANKKATELMQQAGRAVGIITKSVAKKYLGNEIVELSGLSIKSNESNEDDKKTLISEGIDKFFEESLQNHTDKMEAIDELKKSIEQLLKFLDDKTEYQLPMFIFIDELDRCRPDYAIRLLEGIKHLFDAKNVCFVVSTNMTQLSESVKAVYGSGFDAYRYLKRFFAFEYSLPEPDYDAFALMLVNDSILASTNLKVFSGLPEESPPRSKIEIMAANFAIIAKAFNMDLRSQQQSFRSAEAAISAIDDSEPFHCFYMFFLAALYHYNKMCFEVILIDPEKILKLEQQKSHFVNETIIYTYWKRETYDRPRHKVESSAKVSEVFKIYIELSMQNINEIRDRDTQVNNIYPNSIKDIVKNNLPNVFDPVFERNNYLFLRQYPNLIKMAGQIK